MSTVRFKLSDCSKRQLAMIAKAGIRDSKKSSAPASVVARTIIKTKPARRAARKDGFSQQVFTAWCLENGLPAPEYEITGDRYIPGRKFRLDIGWEGMSTPLGTAKWPVKIGIEVQGGVWRGGKHGRGSGVARDMEKRNLGILNGWRVLEFVPSELCMTETAGIIKKLMEGNK